MIELDPEDRAFWKLRPEAPAILAVAAVAALYFYDVEKIHGFFWWLDGTNLIIHEAGHPIFHLIFLGNRFMGFLGGTLFQLLMPLAFYFNFLGRGHVRSADVCLFWLGENFLHIAPYAADARSMDLPLVGGGEHDWNYLLSVFGLLSQDRAVGDLFNLVGCSVMALAVYALCAHWKHRAKGLHAALWD